MKEINIFIHGHGSMKLDAYFAVPKNKSVNFYCHPFKGESRVTSHRVLKRDFVDLRYKEEYSEFKTLAEHALFETEVRNLNAVKDFFIEDEMNKLFTLNDLNMKSTGKKITQILSSEIVSLHTEIFRGENVKLTFHWASCRILLTLNKVGGVNYGVNSADCTNDNTSKIKGDFAQLSGKRILQWFNHKHLHHP